MGGKSPSPFLPLTRDGLVDRVANSLAEAILSGSLQPGDRLAESTIAKQMDLSRAPVREALRLLESSGLVDYKANRGFFVHSLSVEALEHLYELRIVIETASIRRLIASNHQEAVKALRAQLDHLHELSSTGVEMAPHVDADMQFHRLICHYSGNPRFLQVFDTTANEIKLSVIYTGRLYADPALIAQTHEPIFDKIAQGDAEGAVAAMEYHLSDARRIVTGMFRKNQESKQK
ncbi:GntR family transcriptional regulator [Thioclava sp. SK-1]|nr:GntR family transcriptional regulator [Thioclava sp. SK-1]